MFSLKEHTYFFILKAFLKVVPVKSSSSKSSSPSSSSVSSTAIVVTAAAIFVICLEPGHKESDLAHTCKPWREGINFSRKKKLTFAVKKLNFAVKSKKLTFAVHLWATVVHITKSVIFFCYYDNTRLYSQ